MATKADIGLAKLSMASNFALALVAVGVAFIGYGISTNTLNNLISGGAITVLGAVIFVILYWLTGKVTPDS